MVGPAPLGTLGVKRLIAALPVTDGSGTRWVGLARCCPIPLTAVWLPCQCLEGDGELLVGRGQSAKCQLPVWVGVGGLAEHNPFILWASRTSNPNADP